MKQKLNFLAFWAINDKLEIERLCEQLDKIKEAGYDGVVWHMRFYPFKDHYMSADYLNTVSEVILYAKSIGMEFWLYDENGWPSGHCGGQVKKAYKSCRCEWLEPHGKKVKKHSKRSVNILDRKAMSIFVNLTYEAYRTGLKPEAFQYVTGFFSDEVGFLEGHGILKDNGAVPWCREVDERYLEQYGESPEKDFIKLFGESEDDRSFKLRYWKILTDILADNFYKRINDWCGKYGKKYTAHLKAEENQYFQVPFSGSCFSNLMQISVPAVDALERYKSSDYFPRIASSLAKQFHSGEALTEAIGGSGFGLTPLDFYDFIDWLAECGHSTFVLHICQYCHKGSGVIDWPPAIPFSQTWLGAFPTVIKQLKDKYNGRDLHCNTLVVTPEQAAISLYHPAQSDTCNNHNGVDLPQKASADISRRFLEEIEQIYSYNNAFDVTNEDILQHFAHWENGGVTIGNQHYDNVIYSTDCYFENAEAFACLKQNGKSIAQYLEEHKGEKPLNYVAPGLCVDDKKREKHQLDNRYKHWDNNTGSSDYTVERAGKNVLLLEYKRKLFFRKASVQTVKNADISDLRLIFTDPVRHLRVNGKKLIASGAFDRFTCKIPQELLSSKLNVKFIPKRRDKKRAKPFVFLTGEFLVKSKSEYLPMENDPHQLVTAGDFYLDSVKTGMSAKDLITAGFPFLHSSVTVRARQQFGKTLVLKGLKCDAAEVYIDGKYYGYIWDNTQELECPNVEYGEHLVQLVLYPSSYNMFGPHHHYEGDRHLCSPMQFKGKSGFADWKDAPQKTHDENWRFVKFGI